MNIPFSKHAVDALNAASSCARQFGHDHVGAEHVFLSLLAIPSCGAVKRLAALGLSAEDLSESMKAMIQGGETGVLQRGPLPITMRLKKIIDMAALDAGKGNPVDTVHLVLAMLREGENAAAQLLFNAGVTADKFVAAGTAGGGDGKKDAADEAPGEESGGEEGEEDQPSSSAQTGANGKRQKTPTVNAFGRDLTDLARQGKLDPVIGRERELKRIVQIISRRTKNNAVLVGEAGVGKTAVVEGLAQAIHRGAVPEKMQSKRVVAIDMARVVAGTQYRGQFEERLKKIIDETRRSGNIILFLDEIHTMVGAGGAEGAMDAANILKPALARGELQVIGATTLKEYHKSIEKDAALERRFQSVTVDEPTVADTIAILEGLAPKYEEYHSTKYTPAALRAAVELTARYLPARQLPDKAIDALDETGARLRAGASARPKSLTDMQERIDALRGEKDAVVAKGDFDTAAKRRDEIKAAAAEFQEALRKWKTEHAEETIEVSDADVAEREAAGHGEVALRGRHRAGARRQGDSPRPPPQPRAAGRPEAPDRQLPLPRPYGRRQDAPCEDAGRQGLRRRQGARHNRHVGVPGAVLVVTPCRRTARIRWLRRGRPAHREGAQAPVFGRALRRVREGRRGRLQHAAPDS